jgi:hypothetical protein
METAAMSEFEEMPKGMEFQEVIVERILQNTGAQLEICLVKNGSQYEAALFFNKKYKPGPPMPRPLDTPSGQSTHWMGVRPKVGLTAEEAEKIVYEVNGLNALHRIQMRDNWGHMLDCV